MTGTEFYTRCKAIGLHTRVAIAKKMHRDRHTIRRWISGEYPIPAYVDAMLRILEMEQGK